MTSQFYWALDDIIVPVILCCAGALPSLTVGMHSGSDAAVATTRVAHAAWLRSVTGLVSAAQCLRSVEAATSSSEAAGHVLTAMVRVDSADIHICVQIP